MHVTAEFFGALLMWIRNRQFIIGSYTGEAICPDCGAKRDETQPQDGHKIDCPTAILIEKTSELLYGRY